MFFLSLSFISAVAAAAIPAAVSNSTGNQQPPLPVGYYGAGVPAGIRQFSTAGFKNPTSGVSRGGLSICVSGIISVQAGTTHNAKLSRDMIPQNQTALTGMIVSTFRPKPMNSTMMPEFVTVEDTFDIGASLCGPANATAPPTTVELLTHGTGFDRFYWDFAPGYSYVDTATAAGHVVLMYDRLGNGVSSHPDPLIVQTPIQLEIAHSLISMLRAGSIGNNKFQKIVGVGHSFGSGILQAINVHYPTALDATVLTGFGVNATTTTTIGFDFGGNPTIASQADPQRFGDLPLGYMVPQTAQGNQIQFFSYPGFDPAVLAQVEAQKGTQAIGELFSPMIGGLAANYTAPLVVVNGENDWPYCMGDCTFGGVDILNEVRTIAYGNLDEGKFGSFLAKGAGHGLNLHYSAGTAYAYIQDFLRMQGL